MHLSTLPRYAIIVATGALLTGCGGLPTPSTVRPESLQMFAHARKSWMRPDGGTQWLLYVSDYTYGVVDVYNYKDPHRLYGQLTGFGSPNGLCADTAGNVYVVDSQTYDVYEFAHGGTTPIAIAQDIYGRPNGCAFDPTTGNLAVTNGYVPPHYPGNVDVFVGGLQGSQTTYSTPVLQSYQPGGYDPSGNFFSKATIKRQPRARSSNSRRARAPSRCLAGSRSSSPEAFSGTGRTSLRPIKTTKTTLTPPSIA